MFLKLKLEIIINSRPIAGDSNFLSMQKGALIIINDAYLAQFGVIIKLKIYAEDFG